MNTITRQCEIKKYLIKMLTQYDMAKCAMGWPAMDELVDEIQTQTGLKRDNDYAKAVLESIKK